MVAEIRPKQEPSTKSPPLDTGDLDGSVVDKTTPGTNQNGLINKNFIGVYLTI